MSTITEKILAKAGGVKKASPGDIVNADVDVALTHDVLCGPVANEFRKLGLKEVWDKTKIVVTPDHFIPAKDIEAANLYLEMDKFVREQGIENYYPVGNHGICHVMLPEEGFARPGIVIVGTDSHTCTHGAVGAFATGIGTTEMAAVFATGKCWFRVPETLKFNITGRLKRHVYAKDVILNIIGRIGVDGALYMAMEFDGETVKSLSMDERFVLCNMAIEAGAKNGIINPDERTIQYVESRTSTPFKIFRSDESAEYKQIIDIEADRIEPTVAEPYLPSNIKTARELNNIAINQAVIGSCTGGRYSDLQVAAKILKNRRVAPGVRLIIIPATQKIYLKALNNGLLKIFIQAGASVSTPTCGPCIGGHMGVLGKNEVAIASTNRNFKGRMGDPTSKVYLASTATVAASAVTGRITDPRDL
ncbi:MAG: 3-isopropylmalate dehydratase large subunit [Candidatus Odinarchaeum yellowstonii]|uniref:3-isopropylmalate dehydratase large subunit n=1 Tax=Odinarchaeota yellowstonii (strain LCB_4) TaxID=1841599 RepID=A0AAF0D1X5_ODILC|nr:MAG: 3-isopropylmalate dehydratase large subunit [Candidatus Odinarchaeum yellowstonii]